MTQHFIKEITIKKFKCFNDFNASGFKQINLIGGQNNIGKTAFMEACYINVCAWDIKSFATALMDIKWMRESLNLLNIIEDNLYFSKFVEQQNGILIQSNIHNIQYQIKEEQGIKEYLFEINNNKNQINIKQFSFEIKRINNIIFIDNFGFSNDNILNIYAALQRKDKEDYLNKILNQFNSNIESFKIISDTPLCKINNEYLELTELGDGARHLISIIISIFACENGTLFIDEIGNGIHYTKLDELWKVIFKVSKELNVQIFTTTHSKECIEAFNREQQENSCYFELAQNSKTKKIFMRDLDAIQLQYELTHQGSYRGE